MGDTRVVSNAEGLADALADGASAIEVAGTIRGMPMVTLPPGTSLRGGELRFGARGLRLTSDNTLEQITIATAEHEPAIDIDPSVVDWGTLRIEGVTTVGQVQLLARGAVRAGHVEVDGLTVLAADVRGRTDRPHGFGVDAMQGAFTLWNRQPDPAVTITARLIDVGAGARDHPVRGSGVFVGGHGDDDGTADGGRLEVSTLSTAEIHTEGGIAPGTPDLISGGVFVISGAVVEEVVTAGPVTTYGQNDMVLDNWGAVEKWTVTAPVTSHGPSGIGFVNFGAIDRLDVRAPIQTIGPGARGFNLYDGSLRHASFASIATHGDGSIGVQVSRDLPVLEIAGDLTTTGGEGTSLVKGVQVVLRAIALSVKPGGYVGTVRIGGRVATAGDGVVAVEIEGTLGRITIAGGIETTGAGSDGVHVAADARPFEGIAVTTADGRRVVTHAAPPP